MSCIGNFIFTPLLTIFLVLSSLIFITELLAIPNGLLISMLSAITNLWSIILSYGKKSWLIGLAQPPRAVALFLVIVALFLILRFVFRTQKASHPYRSHKIMLAIGGVATSLLFYHHFNWPATIKSECVPLSKQKLTVRQLPNRTIELIDDGFFSKKASPEKFVNFDLKPYLIKKYGKRTIEKLQLNKPSARSLKAATIICDTFTVKSIKVAYFKKFTSRSGWKEFFSLKERAQNEGIEWKRFKTTRR